MEGRAVVQKAGLRLEQVRRLFAVLMLDISTERAVACYTFVASHVVKQDCNTTSNVS